MTATYACNFCKGPMERHDAQDLVRELDGVRATVYLSKTGDRDLGDMNDTHLCTKCAAKVIVEGKPSSTDEIPF